MHSGYLDRLALPDQNLNAKTGQYEDLKRLALFRVIIGGEAGAKTSPKTVRIMNAEYVNNGTQIRVVGFAANARYVFTCDVSYWNAHKDLLGTCELPAVGHTYQLLLLMRRGGYYLLPAAGEGGYDLVFTLVKSSTKP